MAEKPKTQRRQAQFKGPTSSADYNAMVEENYADLALLINRGNLAKEELRQVASRLYKEHIALESTIIDLEDRVNALEKQYGFLAFGSDVVLDADRFNNTEWEVPDVDRLTHDTIHSVMVLPRQEESSLSRLFFVDDKGDDYVPGSMEPRIVGTTGTADDGNDVDTSPVADAILRKPGKIWERNVILDEPNQNGAELTLYIRIPTDLFTVEETNAFIIHPFPAFGVTIRDVSYTVTTNPVLRDSDDYIPLNEQGMHSGEDKAKGWVAPGGWTGDNEGDDEAINAGPRIYYHEPQPITAFRVRLYQPTYYQDGARYVYSYGLSRLDIRKDKFLEEGTHIVRFDAPDGETISNISDVRPHIWNVSLAERSNVFDYRVIWETSQGSGTYTEDPQSSSSRVWIEITLQSTPGWSPMLSGLEIDYS